MFGDDTSNKRNDPVKATREVKARTKGRQCDQNVTCDKWQRNHVFGGGPWNKAR